MTTWEKIGLVFSVDSHRSKFPEWFSSHAQAPNAVDMGDFVRVYFTGRPKLDQDGQATSRGLFVDLIPEDSFRVLQISPRPILELGGVGTFDENGTYPISVINSAGKFYAYYGGWSRNVSTPFDVSIGLATSRDGEQFTKYGLGPVLGAFKNDPFVVTSPKIRKFDDIWVMTYTCGDKWISDSGKMEIIYKLKIAFSKNGIGWERSGKPIIEDILGEDEAQACGDIYSEEGTYKMYFCYRSALDFRHNKTNSYKIGYATSNNLRDWERKDSQVEFVGDGGSWDEEMMAYPNIFQRKGQTYMLYLGNGTGEHGFGAAKLLNA
jgi:hypothetical protein